MVSAAPLSLAPSHAGATHSRKCNRVGAHRKGQAVCAPSSTTPAQYALARHLVARTAPITSPRSGGSDADEASGSPAGFTQRWDHTYRKAELKPSITPLYGR
ncbi:hypothetical protein DQ04_18141010 [Trypanosoma grayi]|uniref:hypothetical protein n=1 Tax=Trypanosoma grayi TaxID=71804 RepID=UPI0004F4292F|nr:hypothetical protein DQ04_18141010 [Trypanosoma grayi]KEG05821.1 hypothetical protein DQ04_18141010 [Trypanosoma grayi]